MFKKVLIANRGAIAVRIERTLAQMGIRSVAVYSRADEDSLHVTNADELVYLGDGRVDTTYLNAEKIIEEAKKLGVDAIHPGYGFLSENTSFARECNKNGITFIGPDPEAIEQFGLKHLAREIARKANVPLLPGTGLIRDVQEAISAAEEIGYPVILKSTAGGGGIGMHICYSKEEVTEYLDAVRHLAEANFSNSGVFVEKYLQRARHIEVQIFGNKFGEVVSLCERDCSVQRRNQKVVEECPAPGLSESVRERMYEAAVRLGKEIGYSSAGTVEFLYDETTDEFYFLEVNTRLQVEHGVTEEVMKIDLVEWMIREAAGELRDLHSLLHKPEGYAIEVRVYAEDCFHDFRPGTGKIDDIMISGEVRVETWLTKNIMVSALYDPMLAKLIVHGRDRGDALSKMKTVLEQSRIYGVTNNMQYLSAFFENEEYLAGRLYTGMLTKFSPEESAVEVLDGGVMTTVQDYPGMIGYWAVGVPPCGPMDSLSFRIGNRILGNEEGAPGLEMTLRGGSYRFRTSVTFCLTGADMKATLDGKDIPMYTPVTAKAFSILRLKECKLGMRTYLTIAGGLEIPKIMGSASTFVDGKFGGHNGRALRTGDVLRFGKECVVHGKVDFPVCAEPEITNTWTLRVLPGPQPTEEYLKPEYLDTLTSAEYEVNFNSARTGVRLNGPVPQWVREDGGEAGLHPSNIHDNAYAVGTLDLTGDQAILLGPDGPSLGGFLCSVTLAKAELWKLGQLHPGDKVRFQIISLEQAESLRNYVSNMLCGACEKPPELILGKLPSTYAILHKSCENNMNVTIRLDGEENILVEYGEMELNIELRFRIHVLMEEIRKNSLPVIDLTPGIRSLQIHFDVEKTNAREMTEQVVAINRNLPELDNIRVPSRILYLPLSWDDPQTQLAAKRYQQTVRHNAPWCPSNPEFIRRINGLDSIQDVKDIVFEANYLVLGLGDVYLGAPVATPVDPRHRLVTTKYNPARPWTPENAVGIGGAYLCVYGMEGPGGYQFVGRTIQMWNPKMETKYFVKGKPWLLNFFDQIKFFPVSAEEILKYREQFLRGTYDIRIEETTFSLGEYKKFLEENQDTIHAFKSHQEASFIAERTRWREQGLDEFKSEEAEITVTPVMELSEDEEAVRTSLPGSVWKVLIQPGDRVQKGDTVIVLESMKMEFPVTADCDGIIENVFLKEGEQINAGAMAACIKIEKTGE